MAPDDRDPEGTDSVGDRVTSRRKLLAAVGVGATGVAVGGAITGQWDTGAPVPDPSPETIVPADRITHRATASSRWDDPETWADGTVPDAGAWVAIAEDATVTLAHAPTPRLMLVRVAGTLRVAPTTDTHLRVDTLLTLPDSRLELGTADSPVAPDATARITFADTGPLDRQWDPTRLGRGLLAMGAVRINGAAVTPWTTCATAPTAGTRQLRLSASPTGWTAGDELLLPGLVPNADQDETRTISAVDGPTVVLDRPLEYDHVPPRESLDAYVLHRSRNVILESEAAATKRRGHVMLTAPGSRIRYARFRNLGRTDKQRLLTNPPRGADRVPADASTNRRARYALHYHMTGIEAADPHRAIGVVIDGSPGWGLVNHHSNAVVTDSITYDVLGAGFVAEGGNERGAFRRNVALRSAGSGERIDTRNFIPDGDLRPAQTATGRVDDLGHAGHGFWLQSPLVELEDNVAAGHRHYGFVYWTRPLLDGPVAEGTTVADRAGTHPNLPWRYLEDQAPLKDAIRAGRHTDEAVPGKVSTAYVRLKRCVGNEAFACAGGLDVSRHQFKWIHERVDAFSHIEGFTAYNLGPFVDAAGDRYGVSKRGAKRGGNQAIKCRYASNIRVTGARLYGRDAGGTALPPHDYLWTTVVEDTTVAGWDVGIAAGEHALTHVRKCTFDNAVDTEWVIGNTGPLVLEDNEFEGDGPALRHELSYADVKAGELLGTRPQAGAVIDGRSVYFAEQRPDYVPIESAEELTTVTTGSGYGHMAAVIGHDDPEAVIGLTNAELWNRFGVATGGALLPDGAVDDQAVSGGLLAPPPSDPPGAAWLNLTTGRIGTGFERVTEATAAGERCLRVTEAAGNADGAGPTAILRQAFTVEAGTYRVHARVWPASWNGDTLWLRLDGGEWQPWRKLKPPLGFAWYPARPGPDSETPYTFDLRAGQHTVELGAATPGVLVDTLSLTLPGTVIGGKGRSANQP